MLNLREGMPLARPVVLSKVGVDHFVDPNHEGIYSGEFSVYFQRDQNGKVDSMIVKNNKLYRKNKFSCYMFLCSILVDFITVTSHCLRL